jgi:hypothetical protein
VLLLVHHAVPKSVVVAAGETGGEACFFSASLMACDRATHKTMQVRGDVVHRWNARDAVKVEVTS